MKALLLSSLFFISSAFAAFNIDTAQSKINWKGQKKLVKSSHEGTLKLLSGSIDFANGEIKSGSFEIDMNSIENTDLTEAKKKADLIGHLKSPDFFETEKYKKASFVIKSAKKVKNNEYKVTGDLTIKDVTKSHEITVSVTEANKVLTIKGETVFDRAVYNVKYNSETFMSLAALGDKVIENNITLKFELVAK